MPVHAAIPALVVGSHSGGEVLHVLLVGDQPHVLYLAAGSVVAAVVDYEIVRDGSVALFPHDAVDAPVLPHVAESPITVFRGPLPNKTTVIISDS